MATTTIDPHAKLVTLINLFETTPEHQDELVRLLEEATSSVMKRLPGFISANIHKSLDGKRVANYAQWASVGDFQRMLQDPHAREHMSRANAIASATPCLYQVVSVHPH
jgi:quinol monooxygenase YgiN